MLFCLGYCWYTKPFHVYCTVCGNYCRDSKDRASRLQRSMASIACTHINWQRPHCHLSTHSPSRNEDPHFLLLKNLDCVCACAAITAEVNVRKNGAISWHFFIFPTYFLPKILVKSDQTVHFVCKRPGHPCLCA